MPRQISDSNTLRSTLSISAIHPQPNGRDRDTVDNDSLLEDLSPDKVSLMETDYKQNMMFMHAPSPIK